MRLKLVKNCIVMYTAAVMLVGCGEQVNSTEDEVLARALEMEYLTEVEFTENNQDKLVNTISSLIQAYGNELENINELNMDVSDSVRKFFEEKNNSPEAIEYAQTIKDILELNDPEYKIKGLFNYSRDCLYVIVIHESDSLLRFTYDENKINTVTEFR